MYIYMYMYICIYVLVVLNMWKWACRSLCQVYMCVKNQTGKLKSFIK